MEIKRDRYLQEFTDRMDNGLIKVITGIRRCEKSYLLFKLFYKYLKENLHIDEEHIIKLALDDRQNKEYLNPDALYMYVKGRIKDNEKYYILLDEVQLVEDFESVLNGFLHIENADTYVTGSNAKFYRKISSRSFVAVEMKSELRRYPLRSFCPYIVRGISMMLGTSILPMVAYLRFWKEKQQNKKQNI